MNILLDIEDFSVVSTLLDVLQCIRTATTMPYPMRLDRHDEPLEKNFSHDKSEFLFTNHSRCSACCRLALQFALFYKPSLVLFCYGSGRSDSSLCICCSGLETPDRSSSFVVIHFIYAIFYVLDVVIFVLPSI